MDEKPNPYQSPEDATTFRTPASRWRRIMAMVVFVLAIIPGLVCGVALWALLFDHYRPTPDIQRQAWYLAIGSGVLTLTIIWAAFRLRR